MVRGSIFTGRVENKKEESDKSIWYMFENEITKPIILYKKYGLIIKIISSFIYRRLSLHAKWVYEHYDYVRSEHLVSAYSNHILREIILI